MNRLILPLAFGLLGGAVLASSCGPTRTCNATTCTGCCDTTGECRSGFDNSACGTRASMCSTCGLGQTCLSGACSTTGSGAGTATGGGFSGNGGGSTGGGTTAGGGTGGGTGGGATACNSTNCPGCCATSGQCFTGRSDGACGTNGSSCVGCAIGQTCTPLAVGGRCLSSGPGGGSAGGGSAGGGSATGGGTGGGVGTGGGATGCSPQNCANGCCFNGQCQTPTAARCGRNGAVCSTCQSTNTCVNGACTPCTGCIDLSTGTCLMGTTNSQCGRQGQFCSDCSLQSRTCQNGSCLPPPPSCTATNCSTGCCDPMSGLCIPRTSQTATQCGQGSAGALCVACSSGTCDTASGSCSTGGFDGGLPPFPDGGFGTPCFPGLPFGSCGTGECCFPVSGFGVCATIGNPNLLGGTTCGVSGMDCNPVPCQMNQTCNASGLCQ